MILSYCLNVNKEFQVITFSEYMKANKSNIITVHMFPNIGNNRYALKNKDEIIERVKEEAKKHNVKIKVVDEGKYCTYYNINGNMNGGRKELMIFATGTVANLKKMFNGKNYLYYGERKINSVEIFRMSGPAYNGKDFAEEFIVRDWYK